MYKHSEVIDGVTYAKHTDRWARLQEIAQQIRVEIFQSKFGLWTLLLAMALPTVSHFT